VIPKQEIQIDTVGKEKRLQEYVLDKDVLFPKKQSNFEKQMNKQHFKAIAEL
jgi:hypothetical protein